ncbi:MAG: valine--pyruvate transaminase [Spirochaetales bacterium]|nr:valine--pyruvate transaminase [Spirochaetales bacterium]MCF7937887.1 valine--pyruvate transaminase [Spirochaetales bacterium]
MRFSRIGEKYTSKSGILALMDDLGAALQGTDKVYMLGGGNPAHIPQVNEIWRRRMEEILAAGDEFERMLANYDGPQGNKAFLEALAGMLSERYGWAVGPENIAVTNGSQSAFYYLFTLFAGQDSAGKLRKVLFPLTPEYVGYADQPSEAGFFVSRRSVIDEFEEHRFKYRVDLDNLEIGDDIAALCVSRPTNPTGNVLTDSEISALSSVAADRELPLFIDNAYGVPFPGIIFEEVKPVWDRHIILGMSLSKLGLPASRTGIIVADVPVIDALSSLNAVMSLATGSVGQVITTPLLKNGEILRISKDIIRPYYKQKANKALSWIDEFFEGRVDYSVHKSEGAIFLWIWFKNLRVPVSELYERLKKRGVIVVPGQFFFYGLEEEWEHRNQCIRINYGQAEEDVRRGIEIIAEEAQKLHG